MQVSLHSNTKDVLKRHRVRIAEKKQAIVDETRRILDDMETDIHNQSPEGVVGTYKKTYKRIAYKNQIVRGTIGIKSPHIEPVDLGFKAHKFPVRNILPWVEKFLAPTDAKDARRKAFAVMNYLSNIGFKGHHVFEKVMEKYKPIISSRILAAIRRVR